MEKRYGILSYNSFNIGDEIQSIAASRFLPRIDYRINREQLSLFRTESPEERVDLIMNAWYMWRPKWKIPQQQNKGVPYCEWACRLQG